MEALAAGHTEMAAHLAAGLAGYAERAPVPVRDHNGFHRAGGGFADREEIFTRAVRRLGEAHICVDTQFISFFQRLASCLADIGHIVDAAHLAHIHPARHLFARVCRQAAFLCKLRKLGRSHPKQFQFSHNHKFNNFRKWAPFQKAYTKTKLQYCG